MTARTSDSEVSTEETDALIEETTTEATSSNRFGVLAFYGLCICAWSIYAYQSQSSLVKTADKFLRAENSLVTDDLDPRGDGKATDDDIYTLGTAMLDDDLDINNAPKNLYDDEYKVDTVEVWEDNRFMSENVLSTEHLQLSSISQRKYETDPKTEFCNRISPYGFNEAPLRVFIYQKGGGEQLVNILIHYLQALTYDEIVVIANEDRDKDDLLQDYLYRDLVAQGIHFWQCKGSLTQKGFRWTEVIDQYKDLTDFVLPIDADEYLSIASPETSEIPHLIWNRAALISTLDNLPPSGGKPYKTLDSKPIPVDCKNHPDADPVVPLFQKKHFSKHCAVPGASKGQLNCFTKNIFEGKEFTSVDNGNHHGPKTREKEFRTKCEAEGVDAVYIPTSFVLVHFQVLQYSDWFLHLIKRVIDYKYMDCGNPQPSWPSFHVCNLYAKAQEVNFSVHELTPMYEDLFCNNLRVYYDISTMTSISC